MEAKHPTESVRLTDAEEVMVRAVAKHRMESARGNGVKDRAVGDLSPVFMDENGAGGEFAVARWLNAYPFHATKRADLTYRGWHVDVKTTHHGQGGLLVAGWSQLHAADVYFLVTGRLPQYELVGWLFHDQVFVDAYASDLGRGPCWLVPQPELRSPEEFRDIVPAWEAFP